MSILPFMIVCLFLVIIAIYITARRPSAIATAAPVLAVTFEPLHPDVHLPEQATKGSAAYDAFSDIQGRTISVWRGEIGKTQETGLNSITLAPGDRAIIPLGFKLSFPHGVACQLLPKSGRAAKEGLSLANAVGLGDSDYPDEYGAIVINHGMLPATINHAEKVAQLCFVPVYNAIFIRGAVEQTTTRSGGFGHSGLTSRS